MSLTHDAVAALKNTFLPGLQRSERKLIEAPLIEEASPPTAPDLLEQSLLAVARDSADIRRSHDAILAKAASLTSLQEDLLEAFDRALLAIEQLAEARSQVAKAEAVAKFEREERGVAAQRLASMTATYHQTVSEVEKLRPENKRLETSLRQTGERLAQVGDLEAQLAEARLAGGQAGARAAGAEAERDDLAKEVASAKRLHQSLLRRVKPMISALREKNAETLRLAATQSDLERRFHDYQSEAGEAIRALQDKEAQLIADLEAERARRVVAEGALAIDRSFRPTETQRRKLAQESEAPRLTPATIAARPNRPPAD
jgi:chromosome segregation ATPase